MSYIEIPARQNSFTDITKVDVESSAMAIKRLMEGLPFNPKDVKTAIDLYCGNGIIVAGELEYLPNAVIHAVDINDNILSRYLQKQKRVKFHQGWVSKVLLSGQLPKADFISISDASRHHGLDSMSASQLQQLTTGYLLTIGDNAYLEREPYFRELFTRVKISLIILPQYGKQNNFTLKHPLLFCHTLRTIIVWVLNDCLSLLFFFF